MSDINKRIGRYHVISTLSERRLLHRAWDPKSRQMVVIAELPAGADASVVEQFVAAGQRAAAHPHPHIAATLDVDRDGHHGDQPFIAIEYVQGKSFADCIRTRASMRPADILEQVAAVSDALAFARAHALPVRMFAPEHAIVGRDGSVRLLGVGLPAEVGGDVVAEIDPHADEGLLQALSATLYDLLAVPAPAVRTASGLRPPLASVRPGLDADIAALADRWVSGTDSGASLAAFTVELRAAAEQLRAMDRARAATLATEAAARDLAAAEAAVAAQAAAVGVADAKAAADIEAVHAGIAPVVEPLSPPTAASPGSPMLECAAPTYDSVGHVAIAPALSADGRDAFQPPQEWNRDTPAFGGLALEPKHAEPLVPAVNAEHADLPSSVAALLAMTRDLSEPLSQAAPVPAERPWQWPLVVVLLAASVTVAVYVAMAPGGDAPPASTAATKSDGAAPTSASVVPPSTLATPAATAVPVTTATPSTTGSSSAAASSSALASTAPVPQPDPAAVAERPVGTSARADVVNGPARGSRPTATQSTPGPASAPAAPVGQPVTTPTRQAPAGAPAAAVAASLSVEGGCLDPSVFARILICESASSRNGNTAVTALPAKAVPAAAVGTSGDAVTRPDGASGSSSAVPAGIAAQPEARDAELVTFVRPEYPDAAKQASLTGSVEVDVTIDATGRVAVASSLSGPMLLRDAAEAAVLQWRFRPALTGGRAVMSRRRFLISFTAVPGNAGGPSTR